MFFTCLLLGTVLYLFAVFYIQRRRQMRIFKDLGIPGPEPNFLFGNLISFRNTMMWEQYMRWKDTYGETFGYFEGPSPVLVTSNADILHQVFIKQFNNFHSRKMWPVQVDPEDNEGVHLFFARGQRWRRLRSVINPAFTGRKLKKMHGPMSQCAEKLVEVVGTKADESKENTVEFLGLFRRLTTDVIVGCGLGMEQDAVHNPDNEVLVNCQGVIEDTTKQPVLYLLGFIFPMLNKLWMWIYAFMHNIKFNPVYWLEDRLKEYLKYRINSTDEYEDLLQQMLNARVDPENIGAADGDNGELKVDQNGNEIKSNSKVLTESEIVAHCLLLLLAGYETSSTTLAYVFNEIAVNPEVQENLQEEIRQFLKNGDEPTYENVRKLKYMDMVIYETLRKYPLASTVVARQCQSTCQVEGLTIPAGMVVQANIWALHKDPKHWGPDPEAFDPTRFTPESKAERHTIAWMPFGAGPRMCVGMRFSINQMKLTMVHLLRRYAFEPSAQLRQPLRLKQGATILPADGVPLRCTRIS